MKNYDDFGDGKYDYMGIQKRIPLHAKKAEEFQKKEDGFNARSHARACLALCATAGMIGTAACRRAQAVLVALGPGGTGE